MQFSLDAWSRMLCSFAILDKPCFFDGVSCFFAKYMYYSSEYVYAGSKT